MSEQIKTGVVYILTNQSFKDNWVKIGYTDNIERRLTELSNATGVPLPFEMYAMLKTTKYIQAERLIHKMIHEFAPDKRINPKREFFNIEPDCAVRVFKEIAEVIDDAELCFANDKMAIISEQSTNNRAEFWSQFEKYFKSRDNLFGDNKISNSFTWASKTISGNEFAFYVTLKSASVWLKPKQDIYDKLFSTKEKVDKMFSVPPTWDIENRKLIVEDTSANIMDKDTWQAIFEFMANAMIALKECINVK